MFISKKGKVNLIFVIYIDKLTWYSWYFYPFDIKITNVIIEHKLNIRRCVVVSTRTIDEKLVLESRDKTVEFRKPTEKDGKEIYRLVRESKTLDVNSEYSYLLWGKYFSETSILALCEEKAIGFVTGFVPPGQQNTLFVWQVTVDEQFRGHGLATELIERLFQRLRRDYKLQYVEATVTPSNIPSRNLFEGFAKKHYTKCIVEECFTEDQFTEKDHEAEYLFRIGPIVS